MILSDKWIVQQCMGDKPLITPFHALSISRLEGGSRVTSFGLSSYGYDLSLGNKFKILHSVHRFHFDGDTGRYYETEFSKLSPNDQEPLVIDPCNFNPALFRDVEVADGQQVVIPPRGFALGVVKERLNLPDDVMGVCMEKSTIARCAVEVTVTPVEAGWAGYLTLEICNKTDYPAVLTAGMGITQLMFFKGDQPCTTPYHVRNGKYQNQPAEPVIARMKD